MLKREHTLEEHSVIIRFSYPESDMAFDFLEDHINEKLEENKLGEYIGHDNDLGIDEYNGTLFMYGPDADKIYEGIKPIVEAKDFNFMKGALVKLNYGNSKSADKKFKIGIEVNHEKGKEGVAIVADFNNPLTKSVMNWNEYRITDEGITLNDKKQYSLYKGKQMISNHDSVDMAKLAAEQDSTKEQSNNRVKERKNEDISFNDQGSIDLKNYVKILNGVKTELRGLMDNAIMEIDLSNNAVFEKLSEIKHSVDSIIKDMSLSAGIDQSGSKESGILSDHLKDVGELRRHLPSELESNKKLLLLVDMLESEGVSVKDQYKIAETIREVVVSAYDKLDDPDNPYYEASEFYADRIVQRCSSELNAVPLRSKEMERDDYPHGGNYPDDMNPELYGL